MTDTDPTKIDWLNRLAKWRMVFTGWQLGTRPKGDPEGDAVRDHREVTILMRAELNALVSLLVEAKIFTSEQWEARLQLAAADLSRQYEQRFPGFRATDVGMAIQAEIAKDTTAGWPP